MPPRSPRVRRAFSANRCGYGPASTRGRSWPEFSAPKKYGEPGRIHVSEAIWALLGDQYRFECRGHIEINGKGRMQTYFLAHDCSHDLAIKTVSGQVQAEAMAAN